MSAGPSSAYRAPRSALGPFVLALAALTACRDLNNPESARSPRDALAAKSGIRDTLPLRIEQRFVAEPGAPRLVCSPGVSIPSRYVGDGVLAPHFGRTTALAVMSFCVVIDDTLYFSAQATYSGATGESLSGLWDGRIGNFHDATSQLRLTVLLLDGTGWFKGSFASASADGSIDVTSGSGSFVAQGKISPRDAEEMTRGPLIIPETMSAGAEFTCGVTLTGAAYCWGKNTYGALGDGTTRGSSAPSHVLGGLTFAQVSAGGAHACGLTVAGAAYCWGLNSNGQLGDGTTTNRTSPMAVAGGLTFTEITAGYDHTCALTASGTTYCWGKNEFGQLGDGTTTDRSVPTKVGRLFAQISAGTSYTCGVMESGLAYCWGTNQDHQLGDGTTTSHPAPVSAVGAGALVFNQISAGGSHACALTISGAAYCWGKGDNGQVGGVYDRDFSLPNRVAGGHTFDRISAGGKHTCAVKAVGGAAYCWGDNYLDQLGAGLRTSQDYEPRSVVNPGVEFAQISAGGAHSCAVTRTGVAYCWGWGENGQLGISFLLYTANKPRPVVPSVIDRGLDFTQLTGGSYHTCGVTVSGAAYCWGSNVAGELGDGTHTSSRIPSGVLGWAAFREISAGGYHTCALTPEGEAYCWGQNTRGELGDGTTDDYSGPAPVAGGRLFVRISAGVQHTCGIVSPGDVYCWGYNANGQLGDGTMTTRYVPTQVQAGGRLFRSVTTGSDHTCALTDSGAAYCWGNDAAIGHLTPTLVPGEFAFRQLSAGDRFTCAVDVGGTVYCWGNNADGQLGDGTTNRHDTPMPVDPGRAYAEIATGESHACATTATGGTYCWGWNAYGQIGDNTLSQQLLPAAVYGNPSYEHIAAGSYQSCGIAAGLAYCWGRNNYGQVGDNTTADRLRPTAITQLLFKW